MAQVAQEVNNMFEPGVLQAFARSVTVTNTTRLDDVIGMLESFHMPESGDTGEEDDDGFGGNTGSGGNDDGHDDQTGNLQQ